MAFKASKESISTNKQEMTFGIGANPPVLHPASHRVRHVHHNCSQVNIHSDVSSLLLTTNIRNILILVVCSKEPTTQGREEQQVLILV